MGSGGYFDQTTSAGRRHLDWSVLLVCGLAILGLAAAALISGSHLLWILAGQVLLVLAVWEGGRELARRRKLGYYAFDEAPEKDK